ncbi:MAG: DUF1330 domain-containing protein [Gammaproteobacteria bacterium]
MGFRNQIIVAMTAVLMLANGGCTKPTETAPNSPETLTMSWAAGEILSVVSVAPAPGERAKQVRQDYLSEALPLAGQFGLRPLGALPVTAVPVGKFKPGAVSFFAWPGAAEATALASHPSWPPIKAKRPVGWSELRIHDVVVEQPVSLRFDPRKTYTMATAWINPERPEDYDRYLSNIADTVAEIGGRFILDMREPAFEAHASNGPAPGRVVFVEWDSPAALAALQKTRGFKNNVALLQSGTTNFELLILHNPS